MVEDAAIKEKNPNAWALTSGGSVYISDSVPEELAGVVGYTRQSMLPDSKDRRSTVIFWKTQEIISTSQVISLLRSWT